MVGPFVFQSLTFTLYMFISCNTIITIENGNCTVLGCIMYEWRKDRNRGKI